VGLKEVARRIKEVANIVDIIGEHISLRRSGRNYLGLCPFHADKKPSFTVSEERQIFHCFGCGVGGDVITFYMKFHNLDFAEAVKELARRFDIPISSSLPDRELSGKREVLFEINEKARRFFEHLLWASEAGKIGREYLNERGLSEKTARLFGLGYAPDSYDSLVSHLRLAGVDLSLAEEAGLLVRREDGSFYDRFRQRLIFPIWDSSGRVAGFGGRVIGPGEPKYLNTPETLVYHKSAILYGFSHTKAAIKEAGFGFVVEGYLDLLSLYESGVKESVATLGTALTSQHVRLLKGLQAEWFLVFDADEAGFKAAMRAAPVFFNAGLFPKVILLPAGHDPDSFVRKYGPRAFYTLKEEAEEVFDFMIRYLAAKFPQSLEGRLALFKELQPVLESIKDPVLFELKLSQVAERLQVSESALRRSLKFSDGNSGPKRVVPYSERALVEFVVHYPRYLEELWDVGLLEVVKDSRLRALLEILKASRDTLPADLALEDLELQALLSEILLSSPPFEGEPPEKVAVEIKVWLIRRQRKARLESLLKAIKEAEASGREEEALRLLKEYQQLRCQF